MDPALRSRGAALLRASGFEDGPALTVQSTDGAIPQGRELSFAWLTGTVMTGLTSVLLMGAALFVSFEGQDTFSTAYEALQILINPGDANGDTGSEVKGDRVRPVTQTRSERDVVEASIRESGQGHDIIKKQQFVRVRATLATSATALSENVPDYDPVAMLDDDQPIVPGPGDEAANPDIYGTDVEGEVSISTAALPANFVPPPAITDETAAAYVRQTAPDLFVDTGGDDASALTAYAPDPQLTDLGPADGTLAGVAENVTVVAMTRSAADAGLGRTERVVTVREPGPLKDTLLKNGFDDNTYTMVATTLHNVLNSTDMPQGTRLRIVMGPSRSSDTLIPYRLSIYVPGSDAGDIRYAATVALTDRGNYVLGQKPPDITFPAEDTEEVNVANLPTLYRAVWETARKHDIDDAITSRIVAMFAYDVDLTKKISPGDSIDVLETPADADGHQELLYVSLKLGSTKHELFRFRTDDGTVDFYDPDGETGKRFLTRRPLQGGGRLASRFGWRIHPIFHTRKLHTGVDLASQTGTPIYAAGDGTVERAGWASGYGNYTMIKHVNGYETGYGHQSKIIVKVGDHVRQGQLIGYVGSTGNSTGPHLHFEIKINGRYVDPLSVKLPRDKSLSAEYDQPFHQTILQIRDLMNRDPSPITVASAD